MRRYTTDSPNKIFRRQLRDTIKFGHKISPRLGLETYEQLHAVSTFKDPERRLLSCYGRDINLPWMVAEFIWILAGRGDFQFMDTYLKNLKKYKDEGFKNYHGSYGMRLRDWGKFKNGKIYQLDPKNMKLATVDQIKYIVNHLKKNPGSRRAVLNLYHPFFDQIYDDNLDTPCNNICYLKIRNKKLHWTQIIRSNDLIYGTYTNVFQFTMLMKVIADSLGVKMGNFDMWHDSLHIYSDNRALPKIMKYAKTEKSNFDIYDFVDPYRGKGLTLGEFDNIKQRIFDTLLVMESSPKVKFDFGNEFWNSLMEILKIFHLKKSGYELMAVTQCDQHIVMKDFQILMFEYLFRTCKKKERTRSYIKEIIKRKYPQPIQDFVMQNETG